MKTHPEHAAKIMSLVNTMITWNTSVAHDKENKKPELMLWYNQALLDLANFVDFPKDGCIFYQISEEWRTPAGTYQPTPANSNASTGVNGCLEWGTTATI